MKPARGLVTNDRKKTSSICMASEKTPMLIYKSESIEEVTIDEDETLWKPMTCRQKWILMCLCLVDLSSFASMSIIAPFFPYIIDDVRHMSNITSGFVFAVYSLTIVLVSGLFGKLIPYIGSKFMLLMGIFICGTANIIFGFLNLIEDNTLFACLCFIVRIIEAIGAASYNTASLIFVFELFPNHVSTAFSFTETFTTLGSTIGPPLGGLLYSWSGYGMPFYVLGAFVYINIPLCLYFVPEIKVDVETHTKRGSFFQFLKIPKIALICLVVLVVSQSVSFFDPTLEPFFRLNHWSTQQLSFTFFLLSGCIAILLPLFSVMIIHVNEFILMVSGLIFISLGLILVGPSHVFNVKPSLLMTLIALVIVGFGYALAFLPTFENILLIAIKHGFSDDLSTYGTVSGLWATMFALGEVSGPVLGGILEEALDFQISSDIMALLSFFTAMACLFYFCVSKFQKTSEV